MTERAYTVREIDYMRKLVKGLIAATDGLPSSRDYETSMIIEDRLRTYMLAGISPADMQTHVDQAWTARDAARSDSGT